MPKHSNTKRTSAGQSPKLERLLLDADINPELEPLLAAVGFQTAFAPRDDPAIHEDVDVLRLARRQRRIMVCHDKFKDRATRYELYPEVYDNGGKIIRISGDSGQEPTLALGKILVHRHIWRDFFAKEKDGMVIVHEKGFVLLPPETLLKKVLAAYDFDAAKLKEIRPRKRTRKRRETFAQPRLGDL